MKQGDKRTVKAIASQQDGKALFRDAMQGVIRIEASDKVMPVLQNVSPVPLYLPDDAWSSDDNSLSEHITGEIDVDVGESFQRPGISRQMLRRLQRGYWKKQAYIDLHGFTRDEAKRELILFLDNCRERGYRCVHIIHGKGIGSKNRTPVLKARVGGWLAQREDVLAFCPAKPEAGGSGATLVLLKKSNLL